MVFGDDGAVGGEAAEAEAGECVLGWAEGFDAFVFFEVGEGLPGEVGGGFEEVAFGVAQVDDEGFC